MTRTSYPERVWQRYLRATGGYVSSQDLLPIIRRAYRQGQREAFGRASDELARRGFNGVADGIRALKVR